MTRSHEEFLQDAPREMAFPNGYLLRSGKEPGSPVIEERLSRATALVSRWFDRTYAGEGGGRYRIYEVPRKGYIHEGPISEGRLTVYSKPYDRVFSKGIVILSKPSRDSVVLQVIFRSISLDIAAKVDGADYFISDYTLEERGNGRHLTYVVPLEQMRNH
jgi:hypothetical protein